VLQCVAVCCSVLQCVAVCQVHYSLLLRSFETCVCTCSNTVNAYVHVRHICAHDDSCVACVRVDADKHLGLPSFKDYLGISSSFCKSV